MNRSTYENQQAADFLWNITTFLLAREQESRHEGRLEITGTLSVKIGALYLFISYKHFIKQQPVYFIKYSPKHRYLATAVHHSFCGSTNNEITPHISFSWWSYKCSADRRLDHVFYYAVPKCACSADQWVQYFCNELSWFFLFCI